MLVRLDGIRERLLESGVAPRHVRRFLSELEDHADDAIRAGLANGLSANAAAAAAWARLGDEDRLVASVLARPELRSVGARFPAAVFGAGPLCLWLAAVALTIAGFAAVHGMLGPSGPTPPWLGQIADALCFFYARLLPLVIGAAMTIAAARQRLGLAWPAAGAALIALSAGTSNIGITLPAAGHKGELMVGNTLLPFFTTPFTDVLGPSNLAQLAPGLALGVVNFALVAAPFLLWRRRRPPIRFGC